MTRKFILDQLENLEDYLKTINENSETLKDRFGQKWVADKIDEILDEINYYRKLLK